MYVSFLRPVSIHNANASLSRKFLTICSLLIVCSSAFAENQSNNLKVAPTPSFDCKKANHPVEKIICKNSDLSKLDNELTATWRSFQSICPDPTQMRLHEQQSWIAESRAEIFSYQNDKSLTRIEAEKYQVNNLRHRYSDHIEGLHQQIAECQIVASNKPFNTPLNLTSPLDCNHPADVVEEGMCLREYVRKPAQQLHAAYASAVVACNDPSTRWRNPLTMMMDGAKRVAKANEESYYGRHFTPENVEFGNLHVYLKGADQPWNDLKLFCQNTPMAERRLNMHITNASKQLEFTLKQLSYAPGETGAHLQVHDAKSKQELLSMDFLSVMINIEGESMLVNSAPLYGNQGTINVGDFNFDGQDDFAVQIGNEGSYSGPNYAVFLRTSKGFTHNQRMSDLTMEGLGFFNFNKKTKTLSTFSKSGCCDHWGITYKVVSNQPIPAHMTREYLSADNVGHIEESVWLNNRWKIIKSHTFKPKIDE